MTVIHFTLAHTTKSGPSASEKEGEESSPSAPRAPGGESHAIRSAEFCTGRSSRAATLHQLRVLWGGPWYPQCGSSAHPASTN